MAADSLRRLGLAGLARECELLRDAIEEAQRQFPGCEALAFLDTSRLDEVAMELQMADEELSVLDEPAIRICRDTNRDVA